MSCCCSPPNLLVSCFLLTSESVARPLRVRLLLPWHGTDLLELVNPGLVTLLLTGYHGVSITNHSVAGWGFLSIAFTTIPTPLPLVGNEESKWPSL